MFNKNNNKISAFFNLWKRKKISPEQITPTQAKEIQKESYRLNLTDQDDRGCSPTFLQIAEQLVDPKQEVFEAAVYYLCQIAKVNPKQSSKILEIFETFLSSAENAPERKKIIETQCHHFKL